MTAPVNQHAVAARDTLHIQHRNSLDKSLDAEKLSNHTCGDISGSCGLAATADPSASVGLQTPGKR